ncbi:hypothetical protein Tco_0062658, partial [Tanacetum coccineum]
DRVDTQSKVPDEQQQKVTESDEESWTFSQDEEDADEETDVNDDSDETESDNDGDNLTHPNLSTYKAGDQEEEEEEEKEANDDEVSSDQRVSTPPKYELTEEEEENKEGDDKENEGEQEQDDEDDLYRDVNINLERNDTEMTDAQANQDTKDAHVTLTVVPLISQTLVNVLVSVTAETPSSDTTIPPPPIPIIQPLQQTPEYTTTTIPTTTLLDIPNFASLFWFKQRVSLLETEMSEFKQTNQFADVVSSISGIIDNYIASKMKDAVDVVVQL